MRRHAIWVLILVAVLAFPGLEVANAAVRLGLILAAHGSPAPQWNAPVLALEGEVQALLSEAGPSPFISTRVAMMEFAEPSIASVIEDMEREEVERALVLPLFIAPSGHSVYDLPAILGLYSDREMRGQLQEEGITVASTSIHLAMGPTLNYGSLLRDVLLERTRELSTEPQSEGIVLLAHGDHRFAPIWESTCQEIGSFICAHTGITEFDFAFVGVGQSFIPEGVAAILGVTERCERTLVLGLYLSMGVESMAKSSELSVGRMSFRAAETLQDHDIVFAARGLLPSRQVARWIAARAIEWANERSLHPGLPPEAPADR